MTEAMPFLRNTILLSYDTRSLYRACFFLISLQQTLQPKHVYGIIVIKFHYEMGFTSAASKQNKM